MKRWRLLEKKRKTQKDTINYLYEKLYNVTDKYCKIVDKYTDIVDKYTELH